MTRRGRLLVPLLAIPVLAAAFAAGNGAVPAERFFLVLIAILVAGKLLGELAERIGQPAVLGELAAGVLLGASALGIIIGAAVTDDVLGLVILAIVSGLAAGAALSLFGIALKFAVAAGFLVAAVIIGAFAAGIVLSTTTLFDVIVDRIQPVADIVTPIFFGSVGAAVHLSLFLPWSASFEVSVLLVGAALLAIAVVGKLASGFAVGWGRDKLSHLAVGIGMVPRGEVGLVRAVKGLRRGILSSEVFSAILIMVMLTTFLAPPLLEVIFRRTPAGVPAPVTQAEPVLHGPGVAGP